ncbi:hypothetical protein V6N13_034049 [Hibiscus sabdariffa]|uniref:Uncharacterized protein n=1 Tax=Hibiscus sabdariffa TaxID=183260 RepID=A0ABR2F8Q3_9ROSI
MEKQIRQSREKNNYKQTETPKIEWKGRKQNSARREKSKPVAQSEQVEITYPRKPLSSFQPATTVFNHCLETTHQVAETTRAEPSQ